MTSNTVMAFGDKVMTFTNGIKMVAILGFATLFGSLMGAEFMLRATVENLDILTYCQVMGMVAAKTLAVLVFDLGMVAVGLLVYGYRKERLTQGEAGGEE